MLLLPMALANPLVLVELLRRPPATLKLLRANALEPPLPAWATIALPKDSPWSTVRPRPAVARFTTGVQAPSQGKLEIHPVASMQAAKMKLMPQRAVLRVALTPKPKT